MGCATEQKMAQVRIGTLAVLVVVVSKISRRIAIHSFDRRSEQDLVFVPFCF